MVLGELVYIRLLAIFLIVNSHLDNLYPFSKLAFGGHLGNSLFYFISGFALADSFQRNPVSWFSWGKKRVFKIIIPVILIVGIVNVGDFDKFVNLIFNFLIWHEIKQLESFLPVLWGLYILFLPLNKLSILKLKRLLFWLMIATFFLFVYRIKSSNNIPGDLPSKDVFFSLSAIICFLLGIYIYKVKNTFLLDINNKKYSIIFASIVTILVSQGIHQYIFSIDRVYIFINFYLNFFTVVGLFILITSIDFFKNNRSVPFFQEIALSSLAVYIVHFKIIHIIENSDINFPYNIIGVYLYSILFAYSVTKVANFFSDSLLKSRY